MAKRKWFPEIDDRRMFTIVRHYPNIGPQAIGLFKTQREAAEYLNNQRTRQATAERATIETLDGKVVRRFSAFDKRTKTRGTYGLTRALGRPGTPESALQRRRRIKREVADLNERQKLRQSIRRDK